jgi:hypothetical protein
MPISQSQKRTKKALKHAEKLITRSAHLAANPNDAKITASCYAKHSAHTVGLLAVRLEATEVTAALLASFALRRAARSATSAAQSADAARKAAYTAALAASCARCNADSIRDDMYALVRRLEAEFFHDAAHTARIFAEDERNRAAAAAAVAAEVLRKAAHTARIFAEDERNRNK